MRGVRRAVLLAVVVVVVSQWLGSSCLSARIHVDPQTHFMMDEFGRVRIFHGVNAVYKVAPYVPIFDHFDPQESLSPQDVDDLYDWGFNFVRLGSMWPGVEAVRGHYNTSYLAQLEQIVDALAEKDIYTLLDCHQDLLSPKFCGEGVPDWAAIPSPTSLPFPLPALGFETLPRDNKTGYPLLAACLKNPFFKYYFAQTTSTSFQSLYNNVNGIQDSFAGFWQAIAAYFKAKDHIIGYEIINEPWPGDIFSDLGLLAQPGKADVKNLVPLYEKVAASIRAQDDQHIIFFEPTVTDAALLGTVGFTQVPGGPAYNNRSVLSYHVYCGLTNPNGDPYFRPACDLIDSTLINAFVSEYKRVGGGGMLTEFGASYDDPAALQQVDEMCNDADAALQSWSWWQFKDFQDVTTASEGPLESFYDSDGSLQLPKVKALSRTYATAIAGVPTYMTFDTKSAAFQLKFNVNPLISKPTEIYLNQKWWYPNGFNVTISPPSVTWKLYQTNRIAVSHPSSLSPGTQVSVSIRAFSQQ